MSSFRKNIARKLFENDEAMSERLEEVYEIFKQQFGEDHVELCRERKYINASYADLASVKDEFKYIQDYTASFYIIFKVDHETVKNELGLSTEIYDLFVRNSFKRTGAYCYGPEYLRTTFTENQLYSKYIHSHCPRLDFDRPDTWNSVCLGTGPINNTIGVLQHPDYDVNVIYGFIAELRQIIRIESLTGGPYIRIETIMGPYTDITTINASKSPAFIKPLIKSYIKSGRLKLGYMEKSFCLGCTFVEWLIDFSQYALAWGMANSIPIHTEKVLIKDNKICIPASITTRNLERVIGKPIITFKGTEYKLKLVKQKSQRETMMLINPARGATILKAMLNTVNYWYGKTNANEGGSSNVIYQ